MVEYISRLKNFRLFENISVDDLPVMLNCLGTRIRMFQKSEFIFLEGDKPEQIGLLLKDTVYIIKEDIWGNKTILNTIKSGDLLGESFVCGGFDHSSVSYQDISDCEVLLFSFYKVLRSCNNSCAFHHRLIENMARVIAQKNVRILNRVEIISKKTIRERVLSWLSQQAQTNGSRCLTSPMGRTELVEYLCVAKTE